MSDVGAEDGLVMRWLKALVQRIRFWRRPPFAVGFYVVIGEKRYEMFYQRIVYPGEVATQLFEVPLVLREGDAIEIVVKAIHVRAPDPNYSKPWWPWSHL